MTDRTTRQDTTRQRRRTANALLCALASLVVFWSFELPFTPAASAEPAQPLFKVIVHPSNSVRGVSQDFVAQAFFKQTMRWENGQAIEPVDLPLATRTREDFSIRVLKRSVPAVRAYWLQRIFSGRQVPPLELDSDAAVVQFVLGSPGAIGYVSSSAATSTAKVVLVE